ncbi:hypothetical protein ACFX14_011796 [Malus domestica]
MWSEPFSLIFGFLSILYLKILPNTVRFLLSMQERLDIDEYDFGIDIPRAWARGGLLTKEAGQTEGVTGPQVIKDGKWVAVDSLPNAFVINLGDQIQVLSNGRYNNAPHGSESSDQQNPRLSLLTGNVLWTQQGHCEWSN